MRRGFCSHAAKCLYADTESALQRPEFGTSKVADLQVAVASEPTTPNPNP